MVFHFTVEERTDPLIVRLGGRLTLSPQLLDFGRRVAAIVAQRSAQGVLLEMGSIEEIDSAGLGELVILYTTASQHGCRLCLVHPTPKIAQLLETTKLSGILPHFDDAVAAASWAAAR
jgi:anti-sigma B factor antagonist